MTTAPELIAHAFAALPPEEQEEAFTRIVAVRVNRLAAQEDEKALFLRSMREVANASDGELTTEVYRETRRRLIADGAEIAEVNAVIRHFGSWRQAKEALGLSEVTTEARIEARFYSRLAGRQRTFRVEELEAALARCVADLGRVPLVAEYSEWRLRELALARTRGEDVRVPCAHVFRRRHGSWEKSLLACGYSAEEVYVRLEPEPERRKRLAKVDRYTEATLRETLLRCARELGHPPMVEEFAAWRDREVKRTRAASVALPSDSPYRRRFGTWQRALLHFGFAPGEIAAVREDGRRRSNASLRRFEYRS